jgi:hypothetical protein
MFCARPLVNDARPGAISGMADDLRILQRWVDSGGVLRVVNRLDDAVTVAMMTCTAGEEADRLTTTNPDVREWLARRDPVK